MHKDILTVSFMITKYLSELRDREMVTQILGYKCNGK